MSQHEETAARAAIGTRIDGVSALMLGRMLRLGRITAVERAAIAATEADAVDADLTIFAEAGADAAELVHARDDAESILVLLGVLAEGSEPAEAAARALHARLAAVDAAIADRRESLGAVRARSPWIARLAAQDASTWWLDLVSLGVLRAQANGLDLDAIFRPVATAPLTLRRSPKGRVVESRLHAEVVGMDDDPARTAIERGAIVARLFDGAVEVYAVGLREDDLAAGVCVVNAESVSLRGVEPGKSAAGWWVPLPPALTGPQELVVRFDGREETLALDLTR